ncbi:MAG: MBL fold metallo-hydrolase [Bacteroidales bacterium]|nr:MBL fold metallo-hydrolase [Bacteroidales bacterium]
MKRIILAAAAAFITLAGTAQERSWEYWKNSDKYLSDQAEELLGYVDGTLLAYPPTPKPSVERRLAFTALDAVLHETRYDDSKQFHDFLDKRLQRVARQLAEKAKPGLNIYKLYDDGFIVKTGKLTAGFDICGNRRNTKVIPDHLLKELVEHCDIIFISHKHQDHADPLVVKIAGEAGIPVFGPADFECEGFTALHPDGPENMVLTARNGYRLPVLVLPGHQVKLLNNIYILTMPGGKTIAHFGDQDLEADNEWLFKSPELLTKRLDVMIINGWNPELEKTVMSFNPKVVLSGHENEMFHGIDHREALWLTQYKFDKLAFPMPAYTMVWGEYFRYSK